MRPITFAAISLAVALNAYSSQAQEAAPYKVAVDLTPVVAQSTGKYAATDLGAALGIGGTVAYRMQQHLYLYGGWQWVRFSPDLTFAGIDRDFVETGYSVGARFEHPFKAGSCPAYRLEAGATYKHVEIDNSSGDNIADSGHKLGYELGAGAVIVPGDKWKVVPMVRYRTLSPEFRIGTVTTKGDVRYVAFELGISRRF